MAARQELGQLEQGQLVLAEDEGLEEQVTSLQIVFAKEVASYLRVADEELRQLLRFVSGYQGQYRERAAQVAKDLVAAYPSI